MANLLAEVVLLYAATITLLGTICTAENQLQRQSIIPSPFNGDIVIDPGRIEENSDSSKKLPITRETEEALNTEDEEDAPPTFEEADSPVSIEEVEMISYEEKDEDPKINQTPLDYLTPPSEGATSYANFG